MPDAEVNGRTLFFLRRGEGEPMLLIQGLSGNHHHWGEPFLNELEKDFELILYDHRGMGKSAPSEGSFTIADLADDAAGLLDALGLEDVHVFGLSMGGMTAQELALRHPAHVRTLTLAATYCGGEGSELTPEETRNVLMQAVMSGDRELMLRKGFELNVSAAWAQDPAHYELFREEQTALPSPLPVMVEQLKATAAHDAAARLRDIEAPTLVLHGTEDRILPVVNAQCIARNMPEARVEILDGLGHVFFWERPERTAELVREHVAAAAAAPVAGEPR